MKSAQYWIDHLQLEPHPEGGFYKEMYRSYETISKISLPSRYVGDRNFCTSIYFLLRSEDISAFHIISSDELCYFHAGSPVDVYTMEDQDVKVVLLGLLVEYGHILQGTIPKNCWFGALVTESNSYAFVHL